MVPKQEGDELVDGLSKAGIVTKIVNATGLYVVPGFVDPHIHVNGGGGEMGPSSRTPEGALSAIISAGTTSLVGLLGTDGVTRDVRQLLQKLNSLAIDGLSTYMYTGGYRVPVPSFFGDVQADITLVDRVIGVGELALSDHRSSWPDYQEVVRIVSDARVAGLLAGKAGVVHFHLGSAPSMIDLLWQIVNQTTIPITNMYPTHMSSRGQNLINEAKKWLQAGGYCDFTADVEDDPDQDTVTAIVEFQKEGVPLNRLTISSDAFGSLPVFDSQGNLISYTTGPPNTPLLAVQDLVLKYGWTLQSALPLITTNPSAVLGLKQKGRLVVNNDADIVVLDHNLKTVYVFGKGEILKTPTWVKQSMFEK